MISCQLDVPAALGHASRELVGEHVAAHLAHEGLGDLVDDLDALGPQALGHALAFQVLSLSGILPVRAIMSNIGSTRTAPRSITAPSPSGIERGMFS